MKNTIAILICIMAFSFQSMGQIDMKDYSGNWEGSVANPKAFNLGVSIEILESEEYIFSLKSNTSTISKTVKSESDKNIQLKLWNKLRFNGTIHKDQNSISGFIKSGLFIYHVQMEKRGENIFIGQWNVFMIDELSSQKMFLNIEEADREKYAAYPFFKDQRFRGTWCMGFEKKENELSWFDFMSGLQFKGTLLKNQINVDVHFDALEIASITFEKSTEDWVLGATTKERSSTITTPQHLEDGWKTTSLKNSNVDETILKKMCDSIVANSITHTHSVLIAKKGNLVFEEYFSDYNKNVPHDQRSASKSISSAMVGIAIEDQILKNVDAPIYNYIPKAYQHTKDSSKSTIRIRHLLTMSSGIDAVDFGIERQSKASEDAYQNSPDWLKTVLEAPMINTPGTHANYGSANPFLLGTALNNTLKEPLELYMDQKLLAPLGITNYVISADLSGQPYFAGGMWMCPRDMLKFGQLYLNKGQWNEQQILSEKWVEQSLKNYLNLENTNDKNGYGFLWWHRNYEINGQQIPAIEARGAGGQYISLVPDLDLVIVITSGNYRNGRFWQPEKIIEDYILPAVTNNAASTTKQ